MKKTSERIGEKFGKLFVIGLVKNEKRRGYNFICECECGNVKIIRSDCVTSGNTVSCGCLKKEQDKKNLERTTHNESKTELHKKWSGMKARVFNENNHRFHRYGGRGIKICKEWLEYENFRDWAKSNGYKDGLSIERVDNNGNYEPSNCKWIELVEQSKNRKNTKWVEFRNEKMCLKDFSKYTKVKYGTLAWRYDKLKPNGVINFKLLLKENELQDNTEVTD